MSRDRASNSDPVKILFVCFGNACRSQIAEALANHLGAGRVRAWSAGSHPLGTIIDEVYDVMAEKGLSLDGHRSKSIDDVPAAEMDVLVTMGCEVQCPVPEGFKGRIVEWTIPDPYGLELEYFRSVRDLIEVHVKRLLADLATSLSAETSRGAADTG